MSYENSESDAAEAEAILRTTDPSEDPRFTALDNVRLANLAAGVATNGVSQAGLDAFTRRYGSRPLDRPLSGEELQARLTDLARRQHEPRSA